MNKELTKKKISIKKLNRIYGGGTFRKTSMGTTTNKYGCVTTKTDIYHDIDDDGVMNNDEWKSLTVCTSTVCPD